MPLQRERCGQGRTRDDVRTVKRRERRAPWVAAPTPGTTTLQNPRAPRGFRRAGGPRPHRLRTNDSARNSQPPAPMLPLRPGRPRSFGCTSAAQSYNPSKSSRGARISPGARLCARSTGRSGLTAREASDFYGCPHRFGAAAAGPRRTHPRSLGCGSGAQCSSRLCGSHLSCPCMDTAQTSCPRGKSAAGRKVDEPCLPRRGGIGWKRHRGNSTPDLPGQQLCHHARVRLRRARRPGRLPQRPSASLLASGR